MTFEIKSNSSDDTLAVGKRLGQALKGGEVIELVGDLGSGKTVLMRGLAAGVDTTDKVQSPSFTLSRLYHGRDGTVIHHFDFHRLETAGVVGDELVEAVSDPKAVVVVEWGGIVESNLPAQRLVINFQTIGEKSRTLTIKPHGVDYQKLVEVLK